MYIYIFFEKRYMTPNQGGLNLSKRKLFLNERKKFTKKYEPLRSKGGYPELSGSTTKKTFFMCVFPKLAVK